MTSIALPWAFRDLKLGVVGSGAGCYQALMALQALGVPVAMVGTHESTLQGPRSDELRGFQRLGLYQELGEAARRIGAAFLQAPDLNAPACVRAMKARGVNLVLSVSAQVLQEDFVQAFAGLVFNIHGSALYRGRAGLTWAILNKLQADRLVLHWVAPAIDAGAVATTVPYEWPARCYPVDIMRAQFQAYPLLLAGFLSLVRAGRIPCLDPQNGAKLYFPLIRGERDGRIDWDWTPDAVDAFVRGFGWPYLGAFGDFRSSRQLMMRVHVARCERLDDKAQTFHPSCNGVPVRYGPSDSVEVITGGTLLRLLTIRTGWEEVPARTVVRLGGRFVRPAATTESAGPLADHAAPATVAATGMAMTSHG